nr:hypothetical protein [Lachnospiraceae bacterium]
MKKGRLLLGALGMAVAMLFPASVNAEVTKAAANEISAQDGSRNVGAVFDGYISMGREGESVKKTQFSTSYDYVSGTKLFTTEGEGFWCLADGDKWFECSSQGTGAYDRFQKGSTYRYVVKLRPNSGVVVPNSYDWFYVKEMKSSDWIKMTRMAEPDGYAYTNTEKSNGILAFYREFTIASAEYWTQHELTQIDYSEEFFGSDQNAEDFIKSIAGADNKLTENKARGITSLELDLQRYPVEDLSCLRFFPNLKKLTIQYGTSNQSQAKGLSLNINLGDISMDYMEYLQEIEVICNGSYGKLHITELTLPANASILTLDGYPSNPIYFEDSNQKKGMLSTFGNFFRDKRLREITISDCVNNTVGDNCQKLIIVNSTITNCIIDNFSKLSGITVQGDHQLRMLEVENNNELSDVFLYGDTMPEDEDYFRDIQFSEGYEPDYWNSSTVMADICIEKNKNLSTLHLGDPERIDDPARLLRVIPFDSPSINMKHYCQVTIKENVKLTELDFSNADLGPASEIYLTNDDWNVENALEKVSLGDKQRYCSLDAAAYAKQGKLTSLNLGKSSYHRVNVAKQPVTQLDFSQVLENNFTQNGEGTLVVATGCTKLNSFKPGNIAYREMRFGCNPDNEGLGVAIDFSKTDFVCGSFDLSGRKNNTALNLSQMHLMPVGTRKNKPKFTVASCPNLSGITLPGEMSELDTLDVHGCKLTRLDLSGVSAKSINASGNQ